MHQLLQLRSTVQTLSGHPCTVETFLGGGGQGEVYRALLDGKPLALKWYFAEQATLAQRQSLETLIRKGPPSAQFLWPMELAAAPDVPGFGYIMPLREARFKGIVDLMKRRIEPSFQALATAGLQLAQAFLELHAQGFCYRDISFGNVFFDPDTGDIQVCDNDNVAINGEGTSGVLGTPRFIAPEVVRGDASPSTQTDLFSLSVLLFYLLHIHHPLEGQQEASIKCFDLPAMTRLYGTDPLFIFDPANDANRPVPGVHDNALEYWPLYPSFLRERFIHAFTAGLHDPHARVRESEWRATLVQLRDAILYCGQCGAENFYDGEALRTNGGQPGACWSCRKPLTLPFRLRVGRDVVMLNHDTQLFPHHLDPQRRYDLSQPLAAIQRHPQNPDLWGLKNLSPVKWVMTATDDAVRDVEPGRSVSLAAGVKVNFGQMEGEIRI
ncbi:serine/threonine protein kinase [Thiocystis minor]|uniref:protein kinase domain-containing protein n=1 Tax=Thiocystis minor TaxID=61597 RepID=UPI001912D3EC|nr:serine/threonine protein kinase [Thiocystis minor]MBK5966070.1 serine/threonine protein kinase [Thiocystis minor]